MREFSRHENAASAHSWQVSKLVMECGHGRLDRSEDAESSRRSSIPLILAVFLRHRLAYAMATAKSFCKTLRANSSKKLYVPTNSAENRRCPLLRNFPSTIASLLTFSNT